MSERSDRCVLCGSEPPAGDGDVGDRDLDDHYLSPGGRRVCPSAMEPCPCGCGPRVNGDLLLDYLALVNAVVKS